jgi:hypothetical protein
MRRYVPLPLLLPLLLPRLLLLPERAFPRGITAPLADTSQSLLPLHLPYLPYLPHLPHMSHQLQQLHWPNPLQ